MDQKFELYLDNARANNLSDHALARLIGQFGNSLITFLLFTTLSSSNYIVLWLVAAMGASLLLYWVTKSLVPGREFYSAQRWRVSNIVCSFIVGFSWSMAPAVFYIENNIIYFVVMISFYSGYIASSLPISSIYKYSFFAFAIGLTSPFALRLFYEGGFNNNAVAGLMTFYVIMMTAVSTNMHKQFIKTTEIQYDNERLIAQLDKEKKIAENAVASKNSFLASASHDLRQPLNAIGLFSEALVPFQVDQQAKTILSKIRKSLNGLNSMLHALLDISKLDALAIDNQPAHLNLKQLVDRLVEPYRPNSKALSISTNINVNFVVFADVTILQRVISNLLDNAVKYTDKGEIRITAAELPNGRISLSIADSGIGIPKEKIKIIFDEFQQLNNPERDREKGLGLGLAIVKRLCKIADIDLSIESEISKGTRATLELQKGDSVYSSAAKSEEFSDSLDGKYILVIDDEEPILEGMRFLLTSWGLNVVTSESLEGALVELQKSNTSPDLIISDLRLRENLTGIDAIEVICEEYNSEIPALLITGDTSPERVVEAQNYQTLYKPVDARLLRLKLNQLVGA